MLLCLRGGECLVKFVCPRGKKSKQYGAPAAYLSLSVPRWRHRGRTISGITSERVMPTSWHDSGFPAAGLAATAAAAVVAVAPIAMALCAAAGAVVAIAVGAVVVYFVAIAAAVVAGMEDHVVDIVVDIVVVVASPLNAAHMAEGRPNHQANPGDASSLGASA